MEFIVLAMVGLSPWFFGSAEPIFECMLNAGVFILLGLWALRILVEKQFTWQKCPIFLCLGGVFLVGIWQIVPLPRTLVGWLSPETGRVYDRLLPEEKEELPSGEAQSSGPWPPGSTLSLYPSGTKLQVLRILSVCLLYAAVRNNITSPTHLKRLCILAMVNGVFLSLFGLVQFFTSPSNFLYWQFQTPGQGFGPFMYRSHFAFYLNLCIGLSFGYLLWAKGISDPSPRWVLHNPLALWIIVALGLMLGSAAFCLSRGGFLALGGAAILFLFIWSYHSRQITHLGNLIWILAIGGALIIWFGLPVVEQRLETIWAGDALGSRIPLWIKLFPVVKDFFFCGTGYGTILYVEPIQRQNANLGNLVVDHAHNDYLESLVEGGILRLGIGLLAIGLVYRQSFRGIRNPGNTLIQGLLLGSLFAFTTTVIHSIGDFGLHMPAIAILVTVICANLASFGSSVPKKESGPLRARKPENDNNIAHFRGLWPWLAAGVLVYSGLILLGNSWKTVWIEKYRMANLYLMEHPDGTSDKRRLDYMESASRLGDEFAWIHRELGQAYLDIFEKETKSVERAEKTVQIAQSFASPLPGFFGPTSLLGLSFYTSTQSAMLIFDEQFNEKKENLANEYQIPALKHFLKSRDLCPLMGVSQLKIAENSEILVKGDSRIAYLERAKYLIPHDPEVWYFCGVQELIEEQNDHAYQSWRRSLELGDRYLSEILIRSAQILENQEILDRVLPDKPDLIFKAALILFPQPESQTERKSFLEKALKLIDFGRDKIGGNLHLKAIIQESLEQYEEALQAYQAALAADPNQVNWRYEYARLLEQQGQVQEARRELLTLLGRQPGHGPGNQLLMVVERRIAENK
jgi:O-antigen ligase